MLGKPAFLTSDDFQWLGFKNSLLIPGPADHITDLLVNAALNFQILVRKPGQKSSCQFAVPFPDWACHFNSGICDSHPLDITPVTLSHDWLLSLDEPVLLQLLNSPREE